MSVMMTLSTIALVGSVLLATDTWSTVAAGIDHLHRIANGQDYHVVKVDLRRPEIYLRASGPGQNGQRTSAWAAQVGATVAINGDLWDADNWSAYEPLGLAVGEGWKWRDDTDIWSFIACDVNKHCWFNPWGNLEANNARWFNAIGGMQDLLVINGVGQYYEPAYYQQRNPRTGIGLSQDGNTMILVVVDGRRSGAAGMNFAEMTNVMLEFGAHNAINNDGGGSSTLVIHGAVRNVPSDGQERVVANHFGIMVSPGTDAACAGHENARLCVDGHNMRTCTGGRDLGLGDCGYFGLRCEQQGEFAYCVDPHCTNGGQNALCLDATHIGMCTDGIYGEGDCAAFGLGCVAGFGTAWCFNDFYQATPVASSLGDAKGGAIDVVVGVPTTVWFELRNSGRKPWDNSTRLVPLPRGQDSPLAGPDWMSAQRATAVDAATAVGEVGRFTFKIVAPHAGDFELPLELVQEMVTWFSERPGGGGPVAGTLKVIVHAHPAADAGVAADAATGSDRAGDDREAPLPPLESDAGAADDGAANGFDAGAAAADGGALVDDAGEPLAAVDESIGTGFACSSQRAAPGPAAALGALLLALGCGRRQRCARSRADR